MPSAGSCAKNRRFLIALEKKERDIVGEMGNDLATSPYQHFLGLSLALALILSGHACATKTPFVPIMLTVQGTQTQPAIVDLAVTVESNDGKSDTHDFSDLGNPLHFP